MTELALIINGQQYKGWKSVSLVKSMEAVADTFELAITDLYDDDFRPIKAGSPCSIEFDGELMLTGYIDDTTPSYDASARSVSVAGRSKTGDLVDCSLPLSDNESEFKNKTFMDVAQTMVKPFGLEATTDVTGFDKAIRVQRFDPGQTVYEYLVEQARLHAVRLVCDEDGDLRLTRAGKERIATPLILGENILSAEGAFSMRERFSHYHTIGQQQGWEENNGAASAHIAGQAEDVAMRYRPTVLDVDNVTGKAKIQQHAEWQRNVNYGRSRQVTYTVNGWQHEDDIWRTNRLVKVIDGYMGIVDQWLMIRDIEFVLDEKGQRTMLTLVPPEGLDLIPLPAEDQESIW